MNSFSISNVIDEVLPLLCPESGGRVEELVYVDYIDYNERHKENSMRQLNDESGSNTKRMTYAL